MGITQWIIKEQINFDFLNVFNNNENLQYIAELFLQNVYWYLRSIKILLNIFHSNINIHLMYKR